MFGLFPELAFLLLEKFNHTQERERERGEGAFAEPACVCYEVVNTLFMRYALYVM
jgi:hypothetical protein